MLSALAITDRELIARKGDDVMMAQRIELVDRELIARKGDDVMMDRRMFEFDVS